MSIHPKRTVAASKRSKWKERRAQEMTCPHPIVSLPGPSRREPSALRGPLVHRLVTGEGRSIPSLQHAAIPNHGYWWGDPSSDPGRQPHQTFLPNPYPALASSWSRGWREAPDTAAPMGPWSRTHGSAVYGRLACKRASTLLPTCSHSNTKTSSPTHPRPVMAARQVISPGHCGLVGFMVSNRRGSQCPVGSPPDWKGPQS